MALGLGLMIINRLSGLVLPTTTKYLMDDVISQGHWELLPTLAMAAGTATLVDASTAFANSQVLGVAAQRAITEMRKDIEAHVMRLPIRYFDSTKSGILISRIMTDAEGIRNLVGTGLVQLTGSILTASIAMCVLLYLNWKLTTVTILILGAFGGGMATAFKRLRPLFRERGQINAEVTGRLAESLGGVRIVKAYTAEKREELVFAKGAHRLFRNVAKSLTGVSAITAFSSLVIGATGIAMMLVGGNAIRTGAMTIGVAQITLYLEAAESLKDKRRVIKSLIQRIHNRFNVAAAAALLSTAVWAVLSTQPAGGLFYFPHGDADALLHLATSSIFLAGAAHYYLHGTSRASP